MSNATFNQPSFLGGEWSPAYQGRIDDPHYKVAMNVCSNGYPVEEGAWTRRSGFRRIAPTRSGTASRVWSFNYSVDFPFTVELNAGGLRIFAGDAPLLDSTASLIATSAGPPMGIFVDNGGSAWATNDMIVLIPDPSFSNAFGSLPNQQMVLTSLGNNQFTLTDLATSNNIDGSQIDLSGGQPTATIGRIYSVAVPWTGTDWYDVTAQVFGTDMFFFHPNYVPWKLTLANLNTASPMGSSFTFAAASFLDGPYLDPVLGQTATPSGASGTITVTLAGGFGPHQSVPTSADVGRSMRFFSEPPVWDAGTSYAAAVNVTYNGLYYSSLVATTAGQPPNLAPAQWYPNPSAAAWVWGTIASVLNASQVTVTMVDALFYVAIVNTWRLGAIGDPNNNPSCGCGHENRMWMFAKTWIYSSVSGSTLTPSNDLIWSPTLVDGTLTDASAISYQLNTSDEDANYIQWAITGLTGMTLGTPAGEWVVKASQMDDPLTATSVQARRVTRYKTYKAKPVSTPLATVFVQKFQRKVMEFLPDVFTGRYVAPNLSATAKHLTTSGVEELAYQEEVTPIIWARTLGRGLIGATYKRTSAFVSEAPAFVGWHRHTHGQSRGFYSLQASPTPDGSLDCIYAVTGLAGQATSYQIERLVKQFDDGDSVYSAWFLDNGMVPSAVIDQGTGVEMWGYYDKAGLSVKVFIGGLDMGSYTVGSLGQIIVPYTSTLTPAYLQSLTGQNFGEASSSIKFSVSTTPVRSATPATIGNYLHSTWDASSAAGASQSLAINFANNQLYTLNGTIGGASSYQLRSYNLVTRAAGTSVNASTLGFGDTNSAFCFGFTPGGNLLMAMDNTAQGELKQVDPTALTTISTFGTSSASLNYVAGVGHINRSSAVGGTPGNYLVALTGIPTLTTTIDIVDLDHMRWSYGLPNLLPFGISTHVSPNAITIGGKTGSACSVYILDNNGSSTFVLKEVVITAGAATWDPTTKGLPWSSLAAYAIGDIVTRGGATFIATTPNTNHIPGADADWNYLANPYISLYTHGNIAPAQVDATWTTMVMSPSGVDIGYDRTDGNLVMIVTTTDSVVQKAYLIKVNGVNAQIMWKLAISQTNVVFGLGASRILNGQLGMMTDAGIVYSVNTLAGTATLSFSPAGIGAPSVASYSYDAVTGVMYASYNYNSGTLGAPSQLSGTPSTFHEFAVYTPGTSIIGNTFTVSNFGIPAIAGFAYNSQGQLLRPATPQDTGAQTGPALGKKRRNSQYAVLLHNASAFTIGTDFTNQFPVPLTTPGGTPYSVTTLFDGVVKDTLSDDYSFDGMLAWATGTSCYPLTITSVGGFVATQDE